MPRTLKTVFCFLSFFALAPFSYAQESDDYTDEPAVRVVSVDEVINPHTANAADYVSDMAHVFTAMQEDSVNKICLRIEKEADIEMLIVTVPSIGAEDPFHYSLELFQRIGVGKKETNRGMLILVAVSDHKWEIRTGYGLEGQFPDAICSQIGRLKMVPKFKENDYAGGITDAVNFVLTLATSDDALAELRAEQEAAEEAAKMAKERENLNYFWILIAIWCVVAFGSYYFNRPGKPKAKKREKGKKAQPEANTDVVKYEAVVPQPYTVSKEVGNDIYVESNPKRANIKYWDNNSIARNATYYIAPALATGVACEVTQSIATLFPMILVCNTWVVLSYFFSRKRALSKAQNQYEKKVIYDDSFKGSMFWGAVAIAPWVGLPAALIAWAGKSKCKDATPPCPKCGGHLTPIIDNDILKTKLSPEESKELELGSRTFKLMACEHGHNIIDAATSKNTRYHVCSHCGTRAGKYIDTKVTEKATETSSGLQVTRYECLFCGKEFTEKKVIPRLETAAEREERLRQESERYSSSSYDYDDSDSGGSYGGGSSGGGGAGGSW